MRAKALFLAMILCSCLLPPQTATAADCGWCFNTRYLQIFYVHEFLIGGGDQGDLACQGDGGGCHTSQYSGTCDENHNGCPTPPWSNLLEGDGNEAPLLAMLQERDVPGILRLVAGSNGALLLNQQRSAVQLVSSCSGQVVLSLPVDADLLRRLHTKTNLPSD